MAPMPATDRQRHSGGQGGDGRQGDPMIDMTIPGFGRLQLNHLVLDYNGTLAVDGRMLPGVKMRLSELNRQFKVHVVTADTHGDVRDEMAGLPCLVHVLPSDRQAEAKRTYLETLGASAVAAVGNGRNDRLMLQAAAVGIGLIQGEGGFSAALSAADVVCTSILDALDLFRFPLRLTATLRS